MVIQKVKECYASTFTDRATYYRTKQGFDHLTVALSAAVQMMVFSKSAGVMFTVDLVTGDDTTITIEGAWGLGEYVVQGTVTPDNFKIRKDDLSIVSRMVNTKPVELVRKPGGDCEERLVPPELQKQQVITDEQIRELAVYAKKIEKHYGCYMDMEWGVDERTNKYGSFRLGRKRFGRRRIKKRVKPLRHRCYDDRPQGYRKRLPASQAVLPAKLTSSSIRLRLLNLKTAKSWLRP